MATAPQSGAPIPNGTGNAPNFPVDLLAYASFIDPLLTSRYANAGARNAAIPNPVDGQITYLISPGRHEEYRSTVGGGTINAWVPLARGRLAGTGALVTNNYGNSPNFFALQQLTNVQVYAARWYRISWSAFVYGGAGAGLAVNRFETAVQGAQFCEREFPFHNASKDDRVMVNMFHDYQAPATRLETFTVSGIVDWSTAGANNPTVDTSSGRNASFTVDDMGWSI